MNPYTLHINLYDVAFLGAIFIGLVFTLLLWFVNRIDQAIKLHRILAGFALLWLLWIPLKAIDYFRYYYHYQSDTRAYYLLYFLLAVIITWIAINVLKPDTKQDEVLPVSSLLPPAELIKKGKWLKKAMETNLLYQDAELNLSSLAEKLDMHPHELSRIINKALKKSFNDFINEYRVRDVIRKMQDPAYDHLTLLGIAFESGFNSRTTFHRIFKEMTGKSPAAYKKELPTYNLEHHFGNRPLILRSETIPVWSHEKSNRKVMFKNYLKIAFRNLVKDKAQSLINISGLAIGFAVALLAGLWVWDELSFDTYNINYSTITQIARKEISKGDLYISDGSNHFPIPLAGELRTNYNNVFKQVALSTEKSGHILAAGEQKHTLQGMFVEKGFTDMFTLKMVAGSAAGFADPHSTLICQSAALALFGRTDAVGKVVKLDNMQMLTVTGVFEDFPVNSSFSGTEFFCPLDLLVIIYPDVKNLLSDWNNSSFFLYANLQPGISAQKASTVIKDVYWAKIKNNPNQTAGNKMELFAHPMKDWHLRSEWRNGIQSGGQIQIVRLFSLIGVFVLLLACINFINLSTARSGKRAKEIGIRKTMGSQRSQLIIQFLGEVFLMVLLAALLGVAIVLVSLNGFNQIAGKDISFPWSNALFWLSAVLFIIITTLISGSYPALYLSSFNPIKVLKGTIKAGKYTALPRKALLTVQFVVSIVLIIGTIVVYRQIKLAQNRPVGYDRNGLIRITMTTPDLKGKYDILQKELLSSGGATGFAESSSSATGDNYFDDHFEWEGKNFSPHNQSFALMAVTPEYAKTVRWQFLAGRNFSRSFATDQTGVILNEAAVKYTGLKHPVGQVIRWNGKPFTVVGVIKDMVKDSPYKPVGQGLFFMATEVGPEITIRLNPALSAAQAISKIEPVFRELNPSAPFDYTFVDDEYAHKFAAEQRIGTLAEIFAVLAVFISCLGVFGLASFIAEQRVKEIGIRKVLGASAYSIWQLFSKDFVVIIFVALLIAIPVAYYAAHKWLESYEYKTALAWWIFLTGGMAVLLITLLTASFHSIKAALANPTRSLRTE
ncbi:MAG TPA: ABC transporter permease [Mucilaginibacter sp.]